MTDVDPQMSRFLLRIAKSNGALELDEKDFENLDQGCVDRAKNLNYISVSNDGAFGVNFTIGMKGSGWRAIGLEPPPSGAKALLTFLRGIVRSTQKARR